MATGKGKKRVKNIPVLYEEAKKKRGVMLTDTAWHSVQEVAAREGISASEYLEKLIREHCVTAG